MPSYTLVLRSDQSSSARSLPYESKSALHPGDVIVVEGNPVLVDDVAERIAECRRLWRFRLMNEELRPVGRGSILTEQRHYGEVETLILNGPDRFRVVSVARECPDGFDGAFVVERLAESPFR